jgi:SAM-dependent methyltransferase
MTTTLTTPDYAALKTRQQAAWASGDYARIGTTLQIVGEALAEAMNLPAGSTALDVAAGNGNVTLALARRGAAVVSTDYVPSLLDKGRARAEAEGLPVAFEAADAEALPFADGSFDAVASTFGVMFAPNQNRAAAEMLRVFRYASAQEFLDELRRYYGPIHKAFGTLDAAGQAALEAEFLVLMARFDTGSGGTLQLPSSYAEVLIVKG